MKRSTVRWTTAIAVAALLAVPSSGLAQTATPPQTPPAATTQAEQGDTPQAHLRKAEDALNDIPAAAVTGQNKTRINDLKQRLNKLERAVAANEATGSAAAQSQAASQGSVQWDKEVAAIDRILTQLIGPDAGAAAGSATGTSGTAGATGTSGARAGNLDASAQAKLAEVRTHVTAFAAAMGKGGSEQAASSSTPPAASGTAAAGTSATSSSAGTSSGTAGATGTSGSMTGSAGSAATTGTAGTQPPATAQAAPQGQSAAPTAQVDPDAAKQHLTAARNSLSEMTQLPAASQLTGDARTQITQLISNFNELITTNAEWRASYTKVEANLTALLGSETTDESAARAASSGTAGAVGTSGSAGALDPGIRAKLVEFRNHLDKFEQAAGGPKPSSASDPAAAASSSTSGAAATGSTSGTTGGSATGVTSGSTGSTAGTSTQQSAETQTQQSAQSGQIDRQEVLRHVQAIETLLQASGATGSTAAGATGTSGSTTGSTATGTTQGGITLTPTQVDQLRTHLNELKRLLEQR